MDPAAHVAAFPLPPDYFFALLPEQIKTMAPPRAPSESCTVFGMPILRDARFVSLMDSMASEEIKSKMMEVGSMDVKALCALLRELKESILLNYLQLLDLTVADSPDTEACLEDLKRAFQSAMYVLAHMRRLEVTSSMPVADW